MTERPPFPQQGGLRPESPPGWPGEQGDDHKLAEGARIANGPPPTPDPLAQQASPTGAGPRPWPAAPQPWPAEPVWAGNHPAPQGQAVQPPLQTTAQPPPQPPLQPPAQTQLQSQSQPAEQAGPAALSTSPTMPWQLTPPPRRVVHTLTRRNWMWVVAITALVAGLVGAGVGLVVGLGRQQTVVERFFPNRSIISNPVDVQAVLGKVEPAVVSINTTMNTGGDGLGGSVQGAGSGMILTPSGEVLTNNHVVEDATKVTVTLFGQTRQLAAHVIGTDPSQDVALVQIDNQSNLPTVQLGDSSTTQVGDDVVAIGNALALQGGPTVTEGIVSAKNRSLSAQSEISSATESLSGLIQTDAPINPGNSGGPLVNSKGQVIGMNTAVAESGAGNAPAQDIGFAIATDTVKRLLPGLLTGGTGGGSGGSRPSGSAATGTPYLGVVVSDVTPQIARQDALTPTAGALVSGLASGGPAEQAGIKVNDVIVSFNGTAVSDVAGLVKDIDAQSPGNTVTVGLYRGSQRLSVQVTMGSAS